jgi:dUTP pyrophosphatase
MMNTTVKFARVRPTAVIPTKRDEDAGFDIYADFEDDFIIIDPHTTTLIPTGIASACDADYCFILKERGSTGSKGIAQRCGVIDSGYRNEWFVPITNTTNKKITIVKKDTDYIFMKNTSGYTIYPYEKAIAQALIIPVPKVKVEELTYNELKEIASDRGMGALGSSGK